MTPKLNASIIEAQTGFDAPLCRKCAWIVCGYRNNNDFAGCKSAEAFKPRTSGFESGPPSYPGLDERESLDEYYGDTFWSESGYLGWEVGDQ